MNEPLSYSAAFLIGLLGSTHCVGMCGGIMGALAFSVTPEQRIRSRLVTLLFAFNLGRILSYTLIGALVGALAWLAADQSRVVSYLLRYLASLMLILLGLYLTGWWPVLRHLESLGAILWKWLQPAIRRVMPVSNPSQALLIGIFWGWLPCGLVYSTLIWSASAATWQQSAAMMFLFGLGTLPALITTGLLLERIKRVAQSRNLRRLTGAFVLLFGLCSLPIDRGSGHTEPSEGKHIHASPQTTKQHITSLPNNSARLGNKGHKQGYSSVLSGSYQTSSAIAQVVLLEWQ